MIGMPLAVSSVLLSSPIPLKEALLMIAVMPVLPAAVGIDVAQTKLDVVLRMGERALHQVFANSPDGFVALDGWLGSFGLTHSQVRLCLEASGSYWDAIALDLFARGSRLSVLEVGRARRVSPQSEYPQEN
jgi:hypothetical protein